MSDILKICISCSVFTFISEYCNSNNTILIELNILHIIFQSIIWLIKYRNSPLYLDGLIYTISAIFPCLAIYNGYDNIWLLIAKSSTPMLVQIIIRSHLNLKTWLALIFISCAGLLNINYNVEYVIYTTLNVKEAYDRIYSILYIYIGIIASIIIGIRQSKSNNITSWLAQMYIGTWPYILIYLYYNRINILADIHNYEYVLYLIAIFAQYYCGLYIAKINTTKSGVVNSNLILAIRRILASFIMMIIYKKDLTIYKYLSLILAIISTILMINNK